jgi:hypothetical protein
MPELADIVRAAGAAYCQAQGDRVLPSQQRALRDIAQCRTPALGGSVYKCDECGSLEYSYHSCRNRHCPKCQEDRAQDWLRRLRARLLPCDHYLLTFTLPHELHPLARRHQRSIYGMLLREAAATIQAVTANPAWVGGIPGMLAVLHTWSRTMEYHPHVHVLVTAGGLTDRGTWRRPTHARFLAPGYVLSAVFRARMQLAVERAKLSDTLDPRLWRRRWVVHVQPIGRGQHAALYLARYVYRVALTNARIERFDRSDVNAGGRVTFRYVHARTQTTRRATLAADVFLARFLQHVLPRGFAKIRSYGLLSPGRRRELDQARSVLDAHAIATAITTTATGEPTQSAADAPPSAAEERKPWQCVVCHHGHLSYVDRLRPARAPPSPPRAAAS